MEAANVGDGEHFHNSTWNKGLPGVAIALFVKEEKGDLGDHGDDGDNE